MPGSLLTFPNYKPLDVDVPALCFGGLKPVVQVVIVVPSYHVDPIIMPVSIVSAHAPLPSAGRPHQ